MRYLIDSIITHGPHAREFHLRPMQGQLPPWTPGAHIELEFYSQAGQAFRNAYSIVGATDRALRIVVQREESGRGGSRVLHDEIVTGMEMEVHGPHASFELHMAEQSATRNVLIAGGIGITPMIAMAHALNASGHHFELHYLARETARLILLDEFAAWQSGEVFTYTTEIQRPDLKALIGEYRDGSQLHACGPVSLMHAIRSTASSLGWPAEHLHFESFGAHASRADQPLKLYLRQSDMHLDVVPGTSILDTMLAAGAFVAYDCQRGECGNCYATVVAGEPLHRDICLTPEQRAAGMTTCVSWAEGPELVLDI